MWLVVTGAVCHSEATVKDMHEQMGCSLLRVGALPKSTDWEVDEAKENKKIDRHWTPY